MFVLFQPCSQKSQVCSVGGRAQVATSHCSVQTRRVTPWASEDPSDVVPCETRMLKPHKVSTQPVQ